MVVAVLVDCGAGRKRKRRRACEYSAPRQRLLSMVSSPMELLHHASTSHMRLQQEPSWMAVRSGHRDRLAHRAACAGVIHPGKFELAAVERHGVELQERIGGDAGRHLGAEYLDAVVAARERADHVLRHLAPIDLEPVAGLHRVLDQDAHPDDLAAPRLARQLDARGHQLPSSSTHADRVTTTLALSIQNEPSDISASATTRWLPASRTREVISAVPARGPRWKLAIRASGLRSEIRWIARTWSASLIGLST